MNFLPLSTSLARWGIATIVIKMCAINFSMSEKQFFLQEANGTRFCEPSGHFISFLSNSIHQKQQSSSGDSEWNFKHWPHGGNLLLIAHWTIELFFCPFLSLSLSSSTTSTKSHEFIFTAKSSSKSQTKNQKLFSIEAFCELQFYSLKNSLSITGSSFFICFLIANKKRLESENN